MSRGAWVVLLIFINVIITVAILNWEKFPDLSVKSTLTIGTDDNADIYVNLENISCSNGKSRCFIPFDDRRHAIWDDGRHDKSISEGIFRTLELFEINYPELRVESWKIEPKRHNKIEGLWLELEPKNISAVR